ncbi:CpXC domain-containing protein [Acetobacterium bakii]|uniref:CpXC domain-containing protein n=1 Tax=Acetobacterium bakii TaxID=52689 RepID=UPI003BFA6820
MRTCPACNHRFHSTYSIAYRKMEKECIIFLDMDDALMTMACWKNRLTKKSAITKS